MLLPPLVGGAAVLCLLVAVALSFNQHAKPANPLTPTAQDEIVRQLAVHLEGTPTPDDVRRAIKPLSERQRLLRAHPYYALYSAAREHFDVSWFLVAAVHYHFASQLTSRPQTLRVDASTQWAPFDAGASGPSGAGMPATWVCGSAGEGAGAAG